MRYSDFKQPLREGVQQQLDKNLDQVGQMVDQGEEENPTVAAKVKDALQGLLAQAKQVLAKRKGEPVEAIEEDAAAATFDIIEEMKAVVAQLCGNDPTCDDPIATQINQKIAALLKALPKAFKSEREAGAEDEFQGEKEFAAEFGQAIKRIAAKATGTLEALEAHYKTQGIDVDAPDQTQVEKAVEDTLHSVFASAAYGAETRKEKTKTRKMLQSFLNDCVKGVIELGPLMDQKQGNIIEAFKSTKYAELTDFFNELLGKVPAGSGAGSWGPAELALSVVGTPVNKAEKGDLNIGGNRKIELKASRKAKSGGRVNTPAIGTGNSGKGAYDAAFAPFAKQLRIPIKGRNVEYTRKLKTGKVSKKALKYTSWGPSLINMVINPAIQKSDIPRSEVINFVREVALAPVVEDHKKDGKKLFKAGKTVRRDGTIDDKAFVAEYLNMVMGFYAETDGVEEVLVINPITGNFHVVDARDMSTIHDKIESGDLQLSSTYLDFTDTQSKASPQIGTE